jgi:protein SCO1
MEKLTRRDLFKKLAVTVPAAAAVLLLTRDAEAGVSPFYSGNTVDYTRTPDRFPNVVLTTHRGRQVKFYDDLIKGKIVLINFFYAQCEKSCPPNTANLRKVQKLLGNKMGREIFFYSITLKPEHDNAKVLADYAEMNNIGAGWELLTGDPRDIEMLRKRLGFVDPDPEVDKDTSNHIGLVLYGNERTQRWSACPALTTPDEIVKILGWIDGSNG